MTGLRSTYPTTVPGVAYPVAALFALLFLSLLPQTLLIYLILGTALVLVFRGRRWLALVAGGNGLVEQTIPEFRVPPLGKPTRNVRLWLGAATVLMAGLLEGRRLALGPGAAYVVVAGVAFVALVVLATSAGLTPHLTLSAMRYFGTGLLVMVLIPAVTSDHRDLKIVGAIIVGVLALSAVAALLQHYGPRGVPTFAVDGNGKFQNRSQGLTDSPITLAGEATVGALVAWGMVTAQGLRRVPRRVFLLLMPVFLLGAYFSYTRTALAGIAAGMAMTVPLLRGRTRVLALVGLVAAGAAVGLDLRSGDSRYTSEALAENGRFVVLWQAAYRIALDHPVLGIGYDSFTLLAPQYFDRLSISDDMFSYQLGRELEKYDPHNDFLRVWQSYGTPALAVYVLLMVGIGANFLRAYYRAGQPWLQGAGLGGFAALLGYAMHSAFHNSLDGNLMLWMLGGFSMAALKVCGQRPAAGLPEAAGQRGR